jgi:hypothetical protein
MISRLQGGAGLTRRERAIFDRCRGFLMTRGVVFPSFCLWLLGISIQGERDMGEGIHYSPPVAHSSQVGI